MTNSREISRIFTGIKNMRMITRLICYDKLLSFSRMKMATAKLSDISATELKDNLEKKYFHMNLSIAELA